MKLLDVLNQVLNLTELQKRRVSRILENGTILHAGITEWCYDTEGLERFTTQVSIEGCKKVNDYEIDELYADLDDFEDKLEEPPYYAVWFYDENIEGLINFNIFYESLDDQESLAA